MSLTRYFIIVVFLFAGCATYKQNRFADLSSTDDQCRILAKKRTAVERPARRASKTRRQKTGSHDASARIYLWDSRRVDGVTRPETRTDLSVAPVPAWSLSVPPAIPNTAPFSVRKSSAAIASGTRDPLPREETFPEEEFAPPPRIHPVEVNTPAAESSHVAGAMALASLLGVGMLFAARKRWKRVSRWASEHPWTARAMIASAHTVAAFSMVAWGESMAQQSIAVSEAARYAAFAAFGTSLLLFPGKHSAHSYLAGRIHHLVLFTSGAVLVLYTGNHYEVNWRQSSSPDQQIYSFASLSSQVPVQVVERDIAPTKILQEGRPRKDNTAAKILLTILAVAVFAGLGLGLAALSCNIACSGSEGLAYLVFFGGMTGLTLLLIKVLKSIFRKYKRNETGDAKASARPLSA